MKKKILFLIKNERNQRYGILSLAAFLKEKGHVLDYVFINREDELPLVMDKIKSFQPTYLAISAMSGEVIFYLSILKKIKKIYPDLYAVMGGPHPTFDKSIIENPYIDAICSGEGEEAFAEFLEKHPDGDLPILSFSSLNSAICLLFNFNKVMFPILCLHNKFISY